jgi:EmrB/QacA subfamily drug resistance transporter
VPPGGAGPTALMLPVGILIIAHVAVYAVWLVRQKILDDAIRQLWQQLATIWARNPEAHALVRAGRPISVSELSQQPLATRADIQSILSVSDALAGLASKFGCDRTTLFSLWPCRSIWASLQPIVEEERATNPAAYKKFEKAVGIEAAFARRLDAAARGQSNVVLVTIAVGIAVLIYALDQTVVATAGPTISQQLGGNELYGWMVSGYTIAATATTLLYGRLADLSNRKTLFVIAMLGFLAGSVLCGMAPDFPLLIGFRAVQGLFGGATFPLAIGIIADTYPIERRAQGFAIVPSTYAFAAVLGPLVGGFLTYTVGWRAVFFINVPVVITAIILLTSTYHTRPRPRARLTFMDVDPLGVLLMFGGIVTLLIGLSTGGRDWSWSDWEEWILLVSSFLMLVGFFYNELHVKRPLLPLRVLRHRGLRGALLTIALLAWINFTLIVFIPQFVEVGMFATAFGAGLALIPLMFTWSVTANIAVRFGQRYGFRNVALCGVPFIMGGLIELYFMRYGFWTWTVGPGLALVGIGAGMINPNMLVMAQSSLSDQDQGLAGGLGNVAMALTGGITAAVLSVVQIADFQFRANVCCSVDASDLLTPYGRFQLTNWTGYVPWVSPAERWYTMATHDVIAIAFAPVVLLALWLSFGVVKTNREVRELRLPPLRPPQPPPPHPDVDAPQPTDSPQPAPAAVPT